jgi:hypothetical protein
MDVFQDAEDQPAPKKKKAKKEHQSESQLRREQEAKTKRDHSEAFQKQSIQHSQGRILYFSPDLINSRSIINILSTLL